MRRYQDTIYWQIFPWDTIKTQSHTLKTWLAVDRICKRQSMELCIHEYFHNHSSARGRRDERGEYGCLVNDDNNKTETQWKLLHQPRVSPFPSVASCSTTPLPPPPLLKLVPRQISTYNRRLTSVSQNGWNTALAILCRYPLG
jgi:hypothetical protein